MSKKTAKKILPSAKETKTAKKAWVAPNYKSKTGGKVVRKIEVFTNQKDHFKKDKGLESKGFATRALHAGCEADPLHGGVSTAIDLSTTFAQPMPGQPSTCFDYSRCGNPTVLAFQRNLASMEKAKYAFATSTGMGATLTVLSLLKQGDHLICIDDVYGGTQRYIRNVFTPQTGIDWDLVDFQDLTKARKAFKKNTKIVWIEAVTNPMLKVTDIPAVAKICKEFGALLVIDNTFMSPALMQPLALGADVVMHSVTKYIGGHSDVLGGALMFNDDDLYDKMFYNMKTIGTYMNAFESYIALRGAKTLGIRVERASENALAIAQMLEKDKRVKMVVYPGLKSHPHYKIAQKLRSDPKNQSGGSGMFCAYLDTDLAGTSRFMSSLKVITLAESLGGVESLINLPSQMTHGSVPLEHRLMLGITDNYVRFSIGIESLEDLKADIKQALAKI